MVELSIPHLTPLVTFLSSAIGLTMVWSSLLNLGKKDFDEKCNEINKWIKGQRVLNLRTMMFPETWGVRTEGGQIVSTNQIENLSRSIDRVNDLERILIRTKKLFGLFYPSFLIIALLSLIILVVDSLFKIGFLDQFLKNSGSLLSTAVFLYIFIGVWQLYKQKDSLIREYEKEYEL